jgi:hypothetical protein
MWRRTGEPPLPPSLEQIRRPASISAARRAGYPPPPPASIFSAHREEHERGVVTQSRVPSPGCHHVLDPSLERGEGGRRLPDLHERGATVWVPAVRAWSSAGLR